ncbi:hypothetical protein [Streptomyces sp. NPDC053367]
MPFRRSVSPVELRETMTEEQLARHATTYQASRGGHYREPERPVPGKPKK